MAQDKNLQQLELTEDSWETNARDAKFYGKTLDEYKAEVQKSRDARELIASLEQQLKAAKVNCKDADKKNLALEQHVVQAIVGDPNFGDDSALYEGTGRIRKSQRKKGLKRTKNNGSNNS